MTLNAIAAVAADPTFQSQVRAQAMIYASTALGLASSAHGAADVKKWALAASTLADGCTANQTRFVWAIAASGATYALTDNADANDTLIATAMAAQWSNVAGVTAGDKGN